MRKEMLMPAFAALLGSVPAALVFIAGDVSEKALGFKWNMRYLAEIFGISAAMVLMIAGAAVVFMLRMIKKIEGEVCEEGLRGKRARS